MILDAARAALGHLTSAPFRAVLLKSLGLSLLVLVALWFGLTSLFDWLALPLLDGLIPAGDWGAFVTLIAGIFAGIAIALGLALLIAPVTALIAGLFLDDVADLVERIDFPGEPAGRAVPPLQALLLSLKFFGIVILGNLVAFALLLVPGVNLIAFFTVNAYLLSREFFEFAAMRYRPEAEAKALRRRNAGKVFAAGFIIAGFLAVPLINLATPLFAAALMVHLHKRIAAKDHSSVGP